MTTNYPTSIDNKVSPTATTFLNGPVDNTYGNGHANEHIFANDAIASIETVIGITGSSTTSTLVYKLSGVTGSDKAASLTGTETLTNKSLGTGTKFVLGSDATGDMYYRASSGLLTRIPIGSNTDVLTVSGGLPSFGSSASFATKGGVQNASYSFAADGGSTDAYAITLTPVPAAYVTGQVFYFKANTANTGGATLEVNSLGAKPIVKGVSTALNTGDIAALQYCTVIYDGNNFVLQNPIAPAGSSTYYGIFKNGVTQKDSADASGTQTIAHGLGAIPKKITITGTIYAAGSTIDAYIARAVYNGTTQSSQSTFADGTGHNSVQTLSLCSSAAGTGSTDGVITFDATNIYIAWTKNNNSATGIYNIVWEAEV